jgi:Domain of unknown function (DUF6950)
LTRLPDWQARLAAHFARGRRGPFAYGSHDCATFAAGAIEAVTGQNPLQELGLRYTTLRDGLRGLSRAGYLEPVAFVRGTYPEIAPALARVGDLAVLDTPEGPALGVVAGAVVLAPRVPSGLASRPLTSAVTAFRI